RLSLIELFGKDKSVKCKERPPYVNTLSSSQLGRLIEEGLIYDENKEIDKAVHDLLTSTQEDDSLALGCMSRLIGRGYDSDIEKHCKRGLAKEDIGCHSSFRDKLDKLGWTRVQVAIDREHYDTLAGLIKRGEDVNAHARDGQTPLHVAAER